MMDIQLFSLLDIMSNAVINICVHVFVWTYGFISLEYIPRRGISASYGYSMFNFLKNF